MIEKCLKSSKKVRCYYMLSLRNQFTNCTICMKSNGHQGYWNMKLNEISLLIFYECHWGYQIKTIFTNMMHQQHTSSNLSVIKLDWVLYKIILVVLLNYLLVNNILIYNDRKMFNQLNKSMISRFENSICKCMQFWSFSRILKYEL